MTTCIYGATTSKAPRPRHLAWWCSTGSIAPHLRARRPLGDTVADKDFGNDGAKLTHEDLLHELFEWISQYQRQNAIKAIGHRIVHGGNSFAAPVRIDDQVMEKLSKLEPL